MAYDIVEWIYDHLPGDASYEDADELRKDILKLDTQGKIKTWMDNTPDWEDEVYSPGEKGNWRSVTGRSLQMLIKDFKEEAIVGDERIDRQKAKEYVDMLSNARSQEDLSELPPNTHLIRDFGEELGREIINERNDKSDMLLNAEEEYEAQLRSIIESAGSSELEGLRSEIQQSPERGGAPTTRSESMLSGLIDVREDQVS